jgi:hypothetical protein
MEVASAPGTGSVTLGGAVCGFRTFASVLASADTVGYFIEGVDATGTTAAPWERGFATFTSASNTLARSIVIESSAGSGVTANFTGNVRVGVAPMTETTQFYPQPGGRLSVISGNPYGDGSTTGNLIWYLPFMHDKCPVWNNGGIQVLTIPAAGVSLNIAGCGAGTCWDVFAYNNAGALGLTMLAWASLTGRSTNVTYQNGFLCLQTQAANRYLGSFYTTAGGTVYDTLNVAGGTGQPAKRLLWNMYNRISRPAYMYDTTASWNPVGSWRPIRGAVVPNACVEVMRGLDEDAVIALGLVSGQAPNGPGFFGSVALDSATATTPVGWGQVNNGNPGTVQSQIAIPYAGLPGLGYHYLILCDNGGTSATISVIGWQSGSCSLIGTVRS